MSKGEGQEGKGKEGEGKRRESLCWCCTASVLSFSARAPLSFLTPPCSFEKRIYIPLPEPHARARMFKIHLGDTPNSLTPADFNTLGDMTEGFSGSDLSVLVREALMEPLRKCRMAKFFRKVNPVQYEPVMADPPCPRCPPDLSTAPAAKGVPCSNCGCERKNLYDLKTEELKVPDIGMEDFLSVISKARPTVAPGELTRFEDWTKEFGSDGA